MTGRGAVPASTVRRPVAPLRGLHVAGVDVIVAPDGLPRLLEVNDRPLMLSQCPAVRPVRPAPDTLTASRPAGLGDVAAELGLNLLALGGGRPVGVILPEAYALAGDGEVVVRTAVRWRAEASEFDEDVRVSTTTADLSAFCNAVVGAGGSVLLVDHRQAGRTAGAPVWNRSQVDLSWHPEAANARHVAAVCIDKLETRRVCRGVGGAVSAVKAARDLTERPAGPGWQDTAMFILKPRVGSASRAVQRGTWETLSEAVRSAGSGEDFIIEPWLESALLRVGRQEYRFDLRVFVIGGTSLGCLLRKASAPAGAPFEDSPLSWLTTTGSVLPTRPWDESFAALEDGHALLPRAWLDDAMILAENAVAAIEAAGGPAGAAADDESRPRAGTGSGIPGSGNSGDDFRALHRIPDRLRPITIHPEPMT